MNEYLHRHIYIYIHATPPKDLKSHRMIHNNSSRNRCCSGSGGGGGGGGGGS